MNLAAFGAINLPDGAQIKRVRDQRIEGIGRNRDDAASANRGGCPIQGVRSTASTAAALTALRQAGSGRAGAEVTAESRTNAAPAADFGSPPLPVIGVTLA